VSIQGGCVHARGCVNTREMCQSVLKTSSLTPGLPKKTPLPLQGRVRCQGHGVAIHNRTKILQEKGHRQRILTLSVVQVVPAVVPHRYDESPYPLSPVPPDTHHKIAENPSSAIPCAYQVPFQEYHPLKQNLR